MKKKLNVLSVGVILGVINFCIASSFNHLSNVNLSELANIPLAFAQESDEKIECDTRVEYHESQYERCNGELYPTIVVDTYTCIPGDYGHCANGFVAYDTDPVESYPEGCFLKFYLKEMALQEIDCRD